MMSAASSNEWVPSSLCNRLQSTSGSGAWQAEKDASIAGQSAARDRQHMALVASGAAPPPPSRMQGRAASALVPSAAVAGHCGSVANHSVTSSSAATQEDAARSGAVAVANSAAAAAAGEAAAEASGPCATVPAAVEATPSVAAIPPRACHVASGGEGATSRRGADESVLSVSPSRVGSAAALASHGREATPRALPQLGGDRNRSGNVSMVGGSLFSSQREQQRQQPINGVESIQRNSATPSQQRYPLLSSSAMASPITMHAGRGSCAATAGGGVSPAALTPSGGQQQQHAGNSPYSAERAERQASAAVAYSKVNTYAGWRVAGAVDAGLLADAPQRGDGDSSEEGEDEEVTRVHLGEMGDDHNNTIINNGTATPNPHQQPSAVPTTAHHRADNSAAYRALAEDFGGTIRRDDNDDDGRCMRTSTSAPQPQHAALSPDFEPILSTESPTTTAPAHGHHHHHTTASALRHQHHHNNGNNGTVPPSPCASSLKGGLAGTGGAGGASPALPSASLTAHTNTTMSAVTHLLFTSADVAGQGAIPLRGVAEALEQVPYHLDVLNRQVEALDAYLSAPATAPHRERSVALLKANSILKSSPSSMNGNGGRGGACSSVSFAPLSAAGSIAGADRSVEAAPPMYASEYGGSFSGSTVANMGPSHSRLFASFVGNVEGAGAKYEDKVIRDPYVTQQQQQRGAARASGNTTAHRNMAPPPASIIKAPRHPGCGPQIDMSAMTPRERWEAMYRPSNSTTQFTNNTVLSSNAMSLLPADDGGALGSPYHERRLRIAAEGPSATGAAPPESGDGSGDASFDCSDYVPLPTPTPRSLMGGEVAHCFSGDASSSMPRVARMVANTNALCRPVAIEDLNRTMMSGSTATMMHGGSTCMNASTTTSRGGGAGGHNTNPAKTPRRSHANHLLIPLAEGVYSFGDEVEEGAVDGLLMLNTEHCHGIDGGAFATIGGATRQFQRAQQKRQLLMHQIAFLNQIQYLVAATKAEDGDADGDGAAVTAASIADTKARLALLSRSASSLGSTLVGGADDTIRFGGTAGPAAAAVAVGGWKAAPPPVERDPVVRLVTKSFAVDTLLQGEMDEAIEANARRLVAEERERARLEEEERARALNYRPNHLTHHNDPNGEPRQDHRHAALFGSAPHGTDVASSRLQVMGITFPSPNAKVTRRVPGEAVVSPLKGSAAPSGSAAMRVGGPARSSFTGGGGGGGGGEGITHMRALPKMDAVENGASAAAALAFASSPSTAATAAAAASITIDYRTFARLVEGMVFGKYSSVDSVDAASLAHMHSFRYK